MENLAPPHELILAVRAAMECGASVRQGIQNYLFAANDDFTPTVRNWLLALDRGSGLTQDVRVQTGSYRLAVLDVLAQGLQGKPILKTLEDLEGEIEFAARREIDQYIGLLPIKLLIPLLLMQFPAYLLILLVPLLRQLLSGGA